MSKTGYNAFYDYERDITYVYDEYGHLVSYWYG